MIKSLALTLRHAARSQSIRRRRISSRTSTCAGSNVTTSNSITWSSKPFPASRTPRIVRRAFTRRDGLFPTFVFDSASIVYRERILKRTFDRLPNCFQLLRPKHACVFIRLIDRLSEFIIWPIARIIFIDRNGRLAQLNCFCDLLLVIIIDVKQNSDAFDTHRCLSLNDRFGYWNAISSAVLRPDATYCLLLISKASNGCREPSQIGDVSLQRL
jgi:hypothetical protein